MIAALYAHQLFSHSNLPQVSNCNAQGPPGSLLLSPTFEHILNAPAWHTAAVIFCARCIPAIPLFAIGDLDRHRGFWALGKAGDTPPHFAMDTLMMDFALVRPLPLQPSRICFDRALEALQGRRRGRRQQPPWQPGQTAKLGRRRLSACREPCPNWISAKARNGSASRRKWMPGGLLGSPQGPAPFPAPQVAVMPFGCATAGQPLGPPCSAAAAPHILFEPNAIVPFLPQPAGSATWIAWTLRWPTAAPPAPPGWAATCCKRARSTGGRDGGAGSREGPAGTNSAWGW